jgi:phage repressor protein C with HTH and peptisase S24 domain
MRKIKRHSESKKDVCLAAYKLLREEELRPYPLHLWGRTDVPELSVFKSAFGSWINVRKAAADAEPWELSLGPADPTFRFLAALENDWQAQRVYPYALVWALAVDSHLPPAEAYDNFFERFPVWQCEYKPLAMSKAWQSLQKNLGDLLSEESILPAVLEGIPPERMADEVEGRLRLRLARDYRLRHGGVLRAPADLVLHRRYSRPDVVNHFGEQYDPAKHNFGVLKMGSAIVIITKIDTSGAKQEHQYTNRFTDGKTFLWQSQNQQRQDNASGRLIVDHKREGRPIYLFVQSRSHEKAIYCGQLEVQSVRDNAPMNVRFSLLQELIPVLFAELSNEAPVRDIAVEVEPVSPATIEHAPDQEYTTHLPLFSLSAAAGYFGRGESVDPTGWVNASSLGKLDKRLFVARARGRSMEPLIHDNDLLVFRANPTGSRDGKIVLAEYRGPSDPDTGGAYTVKKYHSEKVSTPGSEWAHTRITLLPLNSDYEPIEITAEDAEDFRIVAEFVQVLRG